MWIIKDFVGARGVDPTALGEARAPARTAAALGERLLSSGFRASCRVMKAAAQFGGMALGEDAARAGAVSGDGAALHLQALLLSGPLPLSEIAAAQRARR
ncbi:MAG TPA: hypothetical protein VJU61_12210 [Polyangiaceae bacterium]|nr:hypothetical protein [Polyangiaceae bacterium]